MLFIEALRYVELIFFGRDWISFPSGGMVFPVASVTTSGDSSVFFRPSLVITKDDNVYYVWFNLEKICWCVFDTFYSLQLLSIQCIFCDLHVFGVFCWLGLLLGSDMVLFHGNGFFQSSGQHRLQGRRKVET